MYIIISNIQLVLTMTLFLILIKVSFSNVLGSSDSGLVHFLDMVKEGFEQAWSLDHKSRL